MNLTVGGIRYTERYLITISGSQWNILFATSTDLIYSSLSIWGVFFLLSLIFSENTVMSSLLRCYLRLPELVNIQNAPSVDLSWSSYQIKARVNHAYKILCSEDTDS